MASFDDAPGSMRTIHRSVLVLAAGVVLLAVLMGPSDDVVQLFGYDVPVLCAFRRLTGSACPGCGLTRSFAFMAHGMVRQAFEVHPAGPLAFVVVALQVPYRSWRLWQLRAGG
jgi:hypothetical protein